MLILQTFGHFFGKVLSELFDGALLKRDLVFELFLRVLEFDDFGVGVQKEGLGLL